MSSWTSRRNIAELYSGRSSGALVGAIVPARWILSFARTGLGSLEQGEFVVLAPRGEITLL
jgi:hypothetical protein